jgi:hypothetical protein
MRKRWLAFISAAIASVCIALMVMPGAASASVKTVTPDASVSTMSFCNTTGGTIACFSATVTFVNSNTVTLSNIRLEDALCDARSVYALLAWQSGYKQKGSDPTGFPYTWDNTSGCHSMVDLPNMTVTTSTGIQYIKVYLWAANDNGNSTSVPSPKFTNPYF